MAAPLTLEQMRADLAALLRVEPSEIADDDNLIDHGLDSMRLMKLTQRWHDLGVTVPFASLAERPELAAWWRLVSAVVTAGVTADSVADGDRGGQP